MPTGGVPHALGCVIYTTLGIVCLIGTTLAGHGSCNSTHHASRASRPMPPLRLRGRDPSSMTLPPLGTRGLRASALLGRVPLLMVNLMRYVLGMTFANVA